MNCIKIEFCSEDRARIDALIASLARLTDATDARIAQAQLVLEMEYDKPAPGPAPTKEAAPAAAPAAIDFPPADDAPPFEVTPPAAPVKPSVTLAQIQQKATQLAAAPDASIKARIREIINGAGADRVTALPEAAWGSVWDSLCSLESEARK